MSDLGPNYNPIVGWRVFYAKNSSGLPNNNLSVSNMADTHIHVASISYQDKVLFLDDVWTIMQAECWSSFGQADFLLSKVGCNRHASMTAGDVIEVVREKSSQFYECIPPPVGWRKL